MIRERYLQERGHLKFMFERGLSNRNNIANMRQPTNGSQSTPDFIVTIPFFENPEIKESKKARLGKYKPIGRNSDLYSFLGADSREISLNFNMTLPHIRNSAGSKILENYITKAKIDTGKTEGSFDPNQGLNPGATSVSQILSVLVDYEYNYLRLGGKGATYSVEDTKTKALYYFWTNIIRCSVMGTSDHRSPPPTVKLNFGPLYKGVPFVVSNYNIAIDEKAGYDVTTLLPNRLKISLKMEELRVGNFGRYNPTSVTPLDGENVAGWEYIEATGSLDPVFSPIIELGSDPTDL